MLLFKCFVIKVEIKDFTPTISTTGESLLTSNVFLFLKSSFSTLVITLSLYFNQIFSKFMKMFVDVQISGTNLNPDTGDLNVYRTNPVIKLTESGLRKKAKTWNVF